MMTSHQELQDKCSAQQQALAVSKDKLAAVAEEAAVKEQQLQLLSEDLEVAAQEVQLLQAQLTAAHECLEQTRDQLVTAATAGNQGVQSTSAPQDDGAVLARLHAPLRSWVTDSPALSQLVREALVAELRHVKVAGSACVMAHAWTVQGLVQTCAQRSGSNMDGMGGLWEAAQDSLAVLMKELGPQGRPEQ
jgi:hypothetical protein